MSRGHAGQPPESAVELLKAAVSCAICMGIGIATAATICPKIPMPKATSRASARRRACVPWLIEPQISSGAAWFKLGFPFGCPAVVLHDRRTPNATAHNLVMTVKAEPVL